MQKQIQVISKFEYVSDYRELGFDPVPLKNNSGQLIDDLNWKLCNADKPWEKITGSNNIGLRCGGKSLLTAIEIAHNDPFDLEIINGGGFNKFSESPIVFNKKEEKCCIFFKLWNPPPGDFTTLKNKYGIGKFLYGEGVYFPVPPSIINGEEVKIIQGSFSVLPSVNFIEIRRFFNKDYSFNLEGITSNNIPQTARNLLNGKGQEKYKEPHQIDQAIITSLVVDQFSLEEAWNLFIMYKPPKFAEKFYKYPHEAHEAYEYLSESYYKALGYIEWHDGENSKIAKQAMRWALTNPWPGKDGPYVKAVYIAHILIAYFANKTEYWASVRQLAEKVGVSIATVHKANKRLMQEGHIESIQESEHFYPKRFRLLHKETYPQDNSMYEYINYYFMRECSIILEHDAFRRQALGKSSWDIWTTLCHLMSTPSELQQITGRDISTITRCLKKMQSIHNPNTGETISLVKRIVEGEEEYWEAIDIFGEYEIFMTLNKVADAFGTLGMGEKQIEKHQKERGLIHPIYKGGK